MTGGWVLMVVRSTRQLVKAPRITALTDIDALDPDTQVWCDAGREDGKPLVVRRGDLEHVESFVTAEREG